jgi:chemotaxis response regulator CheB
METSSVTKKEWSVLVVEDFLPFRRSILSIVAGTADLQVVGEASHGMEAVQKAVELKPDLILLDIGLPSLWEQAIAAWAGCTKSV